MTTLDMDAKLNDAIARLDLIIEKQRRCLFSSRCFALFDFGASVADGLNAWTFHSASDLAVAIFAFGAALFMLRLARKHRKHWRILRQIKCDLLRFNTAESLSQMECLSDQIDAGIKNILHQ